MPTVSWNVLIYAAKSLCLSYCLSFRNKEDIWCPSQADDECNSLGQVEALGTCAAFDTMRTGLSVFLPPLHQKWIWFHTSLRDKSCRLLLSQSLHSKAFPAFYRWSGWTNRALFKVALRLISRKRGETFEVELFCGRLSGVVIKAVCLRPRHGCDRCQETKLIGHEVFYNEKRIGARVSIHLTSLRIKDSLWTQFIPGPRGIPLMRTGERERIPDSELKTLSGFCCIFFFFFFFFSSILRRNGLTDSKCQWWC